MALAGIAHDTLLESYVLESHQRHDMDALATRFLGASGLLHYADVAGKGASQIPFDQVETLKTNPELFVEARRGLTNAMVWLNCGMGASWREDGAALLNGQAVKPSHGVRPGDRITLAPTDCTERCTRGAFEYAWPVELKAPGGGCY